MAGSKIGRQDKGDQIGGQPADLNPVCAGIGGTVEIAQNTGENDMVGSESRGRGDGRYIVIAPIGISGQPIVQGSPVSTAISGKEKAFTVRSHHERMIAGIGG